MNLLVTGANGFIGSAVVRHARSRGHQVAGLVRSDPPLQNEDEVEGITWLRGSLEQPPWAEIEAFAPEACVHTAWMTAPSVCFESPENEAYLRWSLAFLERLLAAGTSHLLVTGTCIEYALGGRLPLNEATTPLAPRTAYAWTKNALRIALERLVENRGGALCWGRIFYAYGLGEHPDKLCTSIIRRLSRGEEIVLKTPDSVKDYIYIADVASAVVMLLECRHHGAVNLAMGVGVSVGQIADHLGEMLGRPALVTRSPQSEPDALGYIVADSSKLRGLGWRPKYDLQRGLKALVEEAPRQGAATFPPSLWI